MNDACAFGYGLNDCSSSFARSIVNVFIGALPQPHERDDLTNRLLALLFRQILALPSEHSRYNNAIDNDL